MAYTSLLMLRSARNARVSKHAKRWADVNPLLTASAPPGLSWARSNCSA